jgi:two-component system, LytTR family, response regulator
MKVIIIDDEPLARQHVKTCLAAHPEIQVIAECGDGFSGIKAIQELQPDLIFLDIQMPKITGFEMLELIDNPPWVIFTTAFDEYALKAFEAHAIDYLLKPFGQDRLDAALQKLKLFKPASVVEIAGKSLEESKRIVLRHQGEIRIIATKDVLSIEAWDDYIKIHTKEQTFVKKQTLSYYEDILKSESFIRCHRSHLVNITAITAIEHSGPESWEIRLTNGQHIQASKTGHNKLKAALGI